LDNHGTSAQRLFCQKSYDMLRLLTEVHTPTSSLVRGQHVLPNRRSVTAPTLSRGLVHAGSQCPEWVIRVGFGMSVTRPIIA
jgi:hypothetical protein